LSSSNLALSFGTSSNLCSRSCFSSCNARRLSASSSVLPFSRDARDRNITHNTYPPAPSYCNTMEWYFQSEGRCETVISVIPSASISLAIRSAVVGAVSDKQQLTRSVVIHDFLNFQRDCRSALIENSILRSVFIAARTHLGPVVEQPRHGDSLLVAP
jgi:hypothetical protein